MKAIDSVKVSAFTEEVGLLTHSSQYTFDYNGSHIVSLPQPVKAKKINRGSLPLFLSQHMPEGYVRRFVSEMLSRVAILDDLYFLALQGKNGIGHLSYSSALKENTQASISLNDLLTWRGDGLFEELIHRYYSHGLASGVQPKALVPATLKEDARTIRHAEFIVKTANKDYEHLAINEYVCMTLARNAGLNVPRFWLSNDHETFIIERFDIRENGRKIAIDDFSVLTGQGQEKKYNGSYEAVLKVCDVFNLGASEKNNLFKQIVFHCLVGNGDAHLKNFSVMYDEQSAVTLTPVYDITHTEVYAHLDNRLALNLGKAKSFPDKNQLIRFGKKAGIYKAEDIIDEVADSISDSISRVSEINAFKPLKKSIERSLSRGSALSILPKKTYRHEKNRKHIKK